MSILSPIFHSTFVLILQRDNDKKSVKTFSGYPICNVSLKNDSTKGASKL